MLPIVMMMMTVTTMMMTRMVMLSNNNKENWGEWNEQNRQVIIHKWKMTCVSQISKLTYNNKQHQTTHIARVAMTVRHNRLINSASLTAQLRLVVFHSPWPGLLRRGLQTVPNAGTQLQTLSQFLTTPHTSVLASIAVSLADGSNHNNNKNSTHKHTCTYVFSSTTWPDIMQKYINLFAPTLLHSLLDSLVFPHTATFTIRFTCFPPHCYIHY